MGQRGPKSKPAHLHLVTGNPSKLPVRGLLQKLQRPVELPECPADLSDDAKAEWNRLGPLLESLGLISQLDLAAFALYCDAWGQFLHATRKLQALGDEGMVMSTPSGYKQIGPWLSIKNNAAEKVNKYKAEFGLSPADWNRVDASPQGDLFGGPLGEAKGAPESFLR